jgi:predicted small lipoprotein YifL
MNIFYRSVLLLALFSGMTGCGKTGPLYLPQPEPAGEQQPARH